MVEIMVQDGGLKEAIMSHIPGIRRSSSPYVRYGKDGSVEKFMHKYYLLEKRKGK